MAIKHTDYSYGVWSPDKRLFSLKTNMSHPFTVNNFFCCAFLQSLESKSFVANVKDEPIVPGEKVYFHPLDPVFPLSGDLKAPSPGFELGRIPKNADVVIGIPTVKVCL